MSNVESTKSDTVGHCLVHLCAEITPGLWTGTEPKYFLTVWTEYNTA